MKKQFLISNLIALSSLSLAQTWGGSGSTTGPAYRSGSVGINNTSPTQALDVTGNINASGNLYLGGGIVTANSVHADTVHMGPGRVILGTTNVLGDLSTSSDFAVSGNATFANNLSIGTGLNAATMVYVPGTTSFPPMLKFAAPAGTGPLGSGSSGGIGGMDSTPNLSCLTGTGTAIPGFLNTFSQMLSVAYNPTTSTVPGGQILMGHNGINAFIETQGTGASTLNTVQHPGDLYVNKNCGRNVLFFNHSTAFGVGSTNIVSVGGYFNVVDNAQIGVTTATNIVDFTSKLFIESDVSSANGVRLKHGGYGYGLKIATFNSAAGLAVTSNTVGSFTNDGPVTFAVGGDGNTLISTTNTTALVVQNASASNVVNFKVNTSGQTMIGGQSGAVNAAFVNVNVNSPGTGASASNAFDVFDQGTNMVNFRVKASGFVYAREINLQVPAFPDFVFDKNYALPSLESLESYIKTNKHLPGVPTAAEVEKDGANIGELSKIQLEKIEELTLYIIDLKKEVEALKKQVNVK